MIATIRNFPLIDGALAIAGERRARVEMMAADLIHFDAIANEQDAIRALVGNGYTTSEICILLDDARQLAMQDAVAREMTDTAATAADDPMNGVHDVLRKVKREAEKRLYGDRSKQAPRR